MSNVVALLAFEEGWRPKPYLCSEGYPTVGFGFKIGPKGADISLYQFSLPFSAATAWMDALIYSRSQELLSHAVIGPAWKACNEARRGVLISMAYQMGVDGLSAFRNTLAAVAEGRWSAVADEMMDSRWARQTPERAWRHAQQMRSGVWDSLYEGEPDGAD